MLDGNARSLTCVRMGPDVSDLVFKGKMDTPSRKKNDSGCFLGLKDLLQDLLVTVLRIGGDRKMTDRRYISIATRLKCRMH